MEKKLGVFEFVSYSFNPQNGRAEFFYKQHFKNGEPIEWKEVVLLPKTTSDVDSRLRGNDTANVTGSKKVIEKILQGLHLMLGISYYKFYASSIVRHPYKLTKEEAEFWNKIYRNGLGEFYYRNKLDPAKSPKFAYGKSVVIPAKAGIHVGNKNFCSLQTWIPGQARNDTTNDVDSRLHGNDVRRAKNGRVLVGVSGGKDSIVALELLKNEVNAGRAKNMPTAFYVETNKESALVESVIKVSGLDSLKIRRILDQKVFEQHKYNGHIPISAIYAFLGLLTSVLYDYQYFIVANEHSSNFGNIKYKGLEVNHQWSKSSEFEQMMRQYIDNFISKDLRYFSLLRPFYEIRIAKMFSKYPQYFSRFSSCNRNFKIKDGLPSRSLGGGWCGECAKCVFAFIMLSAFLDKKILLEIFGKNLYADENLLPLFKDVLGLGEIKPFDCVGTFDEAKQAFISGKDKFNGSSIVRHLEKEIKINKKTGEDLFKMHISENIPSGFRFCGAEKVLILGYGKEGQATENYLKKYSPEIEIGIGDATFDKNYLKKQFDYDVAIKTPGIKKEVVKIPHTTATNIFFNKIRKRGNKIIGITGSKGKSTTASLIYAILKEAGKSVEILGNIGTPMLESIMDDVAKEKIFVLELSSYQLEDLDVSPDIAVITNLFPEHMDHHGGLENYYQAKKNIINFQGAGDAFVYNSKNNLLRKWAKKSAGRAITQAEKILLPDNQIPLLGQHNRQNIKLAISVVEEFDVSDKIIGQAIKNFKALPHRLELVGEFSGIKFYDDAISTTPESTIMAIEALKNVDTIFLGGEDRGYNFLQLEKVIKKYKIKNAVLFPDSGSKIKLMGIKTFKTKSMEEAVAFAFKNTKKGKICLLSCASPSYSLWKNFEEKGDLFKKFVKELSR